MPNFFEKPKKIQESIQSGNIDHLSNAGKKGGHIRGQQLKEEADLRALDEAEELARQEEILKSAEEHSEANRVGWDDDYRP